MRCVGFRGATYWGRVRTGERLSSFRRWAFANRTVGVRGEMSRWADAPILRAAIVCMSLTDTRTTVLSGESACGVTIAESVSRNEHCPGRVTEIWHHSSSGAATTASESECTRWLPELWTLTNPARRNNVSCRLTAGTFRANALASEPTSNGPLARRTRISSAGFRWHALRSWRIDSKSFINPFAG